MRLFIFNIYILITVIKCLPMNRKPWRSSGLESVIFKAPGKAKPFPKFNILYHGPPPVPLLLRQQFTLNNNDRIHFPDEVPTSDEEIHQKTRSRNLDKFSDNIELPPPVKSNREFFHKEFEREQKFSAHSRKVANFSKNLANHHRSIFDDINGFKGMHVVNLTKLVSRCSGESTFCENVPSYPYETVNEILMNLGNKDFFGLEENDFKPSNRADNSDVENFMCESYTKIIHPQMGKTVNGKWKYIINVDDKVYVQALKVEICKNPKKPCTMSDNFPKGIITSCEQRYMNRRLLSISNDGLPEPDIFSLPAGCSCSYKRNPQFLQTFSSK